MPPYLKLWLSAFAFTQLLECPVYLLAQRGAKRKLAARLGVAFGASLMTHPAVWFIIPPLIYSSFPTLQHAPIAGVSWAYVLMFVVAETFAVVAEGFYLHLLEVRHPWRWALLANATSAGLGLVSRALFDWP